MIADRGLSGLMRLKNACGFVRFNQTVFLVTSLQDEWVCTCYDILICE